MFPGDNFHREANVPLRKMSPGGKSPGLQKGWKANWLGGKKVENAKVQFFQRRQTLGLGAASTEAAMTRALAYHPGVPGSNLV